MSAPATMPADPGSAPQRGAWLREVWRSSIGKKIIVAISGGILAAYVLLHVAGQPEGVPGLRRSGGGPRSTPTRSACGRSATRRSRVRGSLWAVRVVLCSRLCSTSPGSSSWRGETAPPAPTATRRKRIQRSLVLADDARRRRDPAGRLRRLPHPPVHDRHDPADAVRRRRRLPQPLRGVPEPGTSSAIYVASAIVLGLHLSPRALEQHPDGGLGQAQPQPDDPADVHLPGGRRSRSDSRRYRSRSGPGSWRHRDENEVL